MVGERFSHAILSNRLRKDFIKSLVLTRTNLLLKIPYFDSLIPESSLFLLSPYFTIIAINE